MRTSQFQTSGRLVASEKVEATPSRPGESRAEAQRRRGVFDLAMGVRQGNALGPYPFAHCSRIHRIQRTKAVAGITAPRRKPLPPELRVFASSKFTFHLPSPLPVLPIPLSAPLRESFPSGYANACSTWLSLDPTHVPRERHRCRCKMETISPAGSRASTARPVRPSVVAPSAACRASSSMRDQSPRG